jgi:outer membrane protein assembly factor BamB
MTRFATLLAVGPVVWCALATGAMGGQPVGWRTDWTGRYPDADPPTRWSSSDGIVWKCPMPSWSNATPVLVGERLFVCAEPTTLLCLDANSGQILWQRTNPIGDALPAEVRKKLQDLDANSLARRFHQAQSQLSRAENDLKKSPQDANLLARTGVLEKQVLEANARLEPIRDYLIPEPHAVAGFTTPTPVSDGDSVFVLFGTGVAACYDLDGNRRWITLAEPPRITYGHSASPLLIGDELIVHVNSLVALSAATGQRLWSSPAEACWGTSVAAPSGEETIIITPAAELFRARDGQKVASVNAKIRFSQPLAQNGVAYFIEGQSHAYRLPPSLRGLDPNGGTKLAEIWKARPNKERRYASPVLDNGVIYTVTEVGVFSAIDANTGSVLYEQDFRIHDSNRAFPSISVAGRYVYVSDSGGLTVVVEAGREFKEIARNQLEPFRSSLVFRERRLYIRGMKNLYCIAQ